jgi:hypothetical protein
MDNWLVYYVEDSPAPAHGLHQYTQTLETNDGREIFESGDRSDLPRMMRLASALEDAIQQMRAFFNVRENDQLSLLIEGRLENDESIDIGLPRHPNSYFTVERILDVISEKLTSAQTLKSQFNLVWVYYQTLENQIFGYAFRGDWSKFVATKQSFIQIHPEHDPYRHENECFVQWIVMCLAFWKREHPEAEFTETFNYLRIKQNTLSNFRGQRGFKFRHGFAKRFKSIFPNRDRDFSLLKEIEDQLPIRFCLYGFSPEERTFKIVYPAANVLPYADEKFTCFGVCHKSNQILTHVDFVVNADAIDLFPLHLNSKGKTPTGHVCRKCFQFYVLNPFCKHGKTDEEIAKRTKNNIRNKQCESCPQCHVCDGICSYCMRPKAECVPHHPTKCTECFKICPSFDCLKTHLDLNFCRGYREKYTPTATCFLCGEEPHEGGCFLTRKSLKKPSTEYAVYDFECALDEQNHHVPYCVTVCFPYGHKKLDVLESKYPFKKVSNVSVFVFWGLHTEQFWEFLTDDLLRGFCFFAHNARAYDSILIKSYLWKVKGWVSQDICRGRKFLQLSYPKYELTFRDSLCFIPTTLRSLSSDFGIEEFRKGYFPHKWMTVERFLSIPPNGIVEHPGAEFFESDLSKKEQKEFQEFLSEFLKLKDWNVQQDAIEYCISDTILLSETLKRFRDETMTMCETIERSADTEMEPFDPFCYMTLPSSMMSFYFSQCLPEKTIACIDRYMINVEAKARAWLNSIGKQHCWTWEMDQGCQITGREEKDLYLFYACELNGCVTCFPKIRQGQWHPRMQSTYEKARQRREQGERSFMDQGFKLHIFWEHDYREQDMDPLFVGLDPRDAYKGGKTELYKLRVPGECAMVDFVSQYPTVCYGESVDPLNLEQESIMKWDLPIGQPIRLYRPENYDFNSDRLGIAKILVLPPRQLYAPLLSYRLEGAYGELEVCYGCCRTCMETKSYSCGHSPQERAFIGTWTLSEIRYALTLGYSVEQVVEVWEYPQKSHTLFRSFIVPFMYNKIVSKSTGLVSDGKFTAKGNQVAQYLRDIMNREIKCEEFSNSPARRTVAKLIQNAFTGKWGQRDVFTCTASFTEKDTWESAQLLNNPNVSIQSAMVMPGQCVTINYESVRGAALSGLRKKNDHIVAHITAYGRMMLNRVEQALKKDLVYVDTDSAYHRQTDSPVYRTGFRTGDLELECSSLHNWAALARKSYAYETEGKTVVKQKGIAMKCSLEPFFSPEKLLNLIQSTKRKMEDVDEEEHTVKKFKSHQPTIKVPQIHFRTEKQHLDVFKQTQTSLKDTRLNVFSSKRMICWSDDGVLDTLPYGYH